METRIAILTPSDVLSDGFLLSFRKYSFQSSALQDVMSFDPVAWDVLLLDERIGEGNGITDFIKQYLATCPNLKIVVMSPACNGVRVLVALEAGAVAYLCLKDQLTDRLPLIIRDILSGTMHLSPRAQRAYSELQDADIRLIQKLTEYQRQTLALLIAGYTTAEIANSLGKSSSAIYQLITRLREAFAVDENCQLIEKAKQYGLGGMSNI